MHTRFAGIGFALALSPSNLHAALDAPTLLEPLDGAICPSDSVRVVLSWESVEGAAYYRVGVGVGDDSCDAAFVIGTTDLTRTYLMWGGTRRWWVEAVDAEDVYGERSECRSFFSPSPPLLTGLAVTSAGIANHYRFEWEPSPDAVSYSLGVFTSCGELAEPIATFPTEGTSLVVDLGPYDLSRLLYGRIRSVTCAGLRSPFQNCAPANCERFDPPTAPTNCIAEALPCPGRVRVTWENNGSRSTLYRDGVEVISTGGLQYTDRGLEPGIEVRYTVTAITSCYESNPSNEAFATPTEREALVAPALLFPPDGTECAVDAFNYVNFSWTAVEGALTYRIGYGGDDCDEVNRTRVSPVPEFRAWVGEEAVNRWWVEPIDDCDETGPRSACFTFTGAVPPATPTLEVTYDPADRGVVHLDWSEGEGALGYEVVVSESCGPTGTEFARIETTESMATMDLEPWVDEPALTVNVKQFQCNDQFGLPACEILQFPTPVLLEGFTAAARGGSVELLWRTRIVDGAVGFHVWRADEDSDAFLRLTPSPIPLAEEGAYAFVDDHAAGGRTYRYRLDEVLPTGETAVLATTRVTTPPTSVALTARPNPFNPRTTLSIALPNNTEATLRIYDPTGRLVRAVASGVLAAGRHDFVWDGRDNAQQEVASGIYYAHLSADNITRIQRLVLLR